ncbi:SDR family oxidoreductase [Tanticharoenia sakaeratensis]|jgi:NAD(P)-dependent dehydrogenase (short-subunit alcohol dehydrogenase family)|uniref:Oxidoreductase n=1 Tax=Tanticharoenia sakaeratensis NBRC 103193 TaxID=1231623 RepID=A0A0D6MHW8_9PROT|nr:SDR family oxidoreductase [Tanticharoenia sakaeratensis]GAN52853.1 oxidoreductase [Tanticharoenia sakaeratensis NBRC 103193]GBQ18378.1 oxidoreductase [Tanticharoenia sakaeratensis NBRC 103193]
MSPPAETPDPRTRYPQPPFETQPQDFPGLSRDMSPEPNYGEDTYIGSGRLSGHVSLITGGDSGIGRAVAIAFAKEGSDIALAYLEAEEEDARDVAASIERVGRRVLLLPGDIRDAAHCRALVARTMAEFGRLDTLVNNAAFQHPRESLTEIDDEEWRRHFDTNCHAMFYITKAALPHLKPGASIINTSSVNAKMPMPILIPYSMTKAAIANFTVSLAGSLVEQGIRVNAVLPGPIWTPFIATGMPAEEHKKFGSQAPMGRPGQPAELAGAYVYLADPNNSYTSGALLPVDGGMPIY